MNLEKDLQREMAESMLRDVISANAYDLLIKDYKKLFKDKIVLDVGCRSGLLSLMSVEVGAVKVIAVGNMQSAKLVKNTLAQGDKEDIFEAVKGAIQEIRLPCGLKYVDIIVSEWLGHSIFVDSLFREVIFAREKWLAKGGIIIPNVAQLYVSGISKHRRPNAQVNAFGNSCKVWEDHVTKEELITDKFLVKTIDLCTASIDDDAFRLPIKLKALKDSSFGAVVLHMDVSFSRAKGRLRRLFSTSPAEPRTYLKQTILFLDEAIQVAEHQWLLGVLGMYPNPKEHRGVQYSLSFGEDEPKEGQDDYVDLV
ncbi:hypothetical protein KR032_003068 [Drosophila birchii]|nr:hypothetical protein KR032_003068 [Drosophila birchii]